MSKNLIPLFVILTVTIVLNLNDIAFAEEVKNSIKPGLLNREELEREAELRAEELKKVNQQIAEIQENIRTVLNERATLKNEIKKINYTIKQLQLSMASNELSIQKLGYELESLALDIEDIGQTIQDKRKAVRAIFRELQKRADNSGLFFVLLKNTRLADAVRAMQELADLNVQLETDIRYLGELGAKIESRKVAAEKKREEIMLNQRSLIIRKQLIEDQEKGKQILLEQTKNRESAYQAQLSELEKQQQAIEDEIDKIEDELRSRFDISLLPAKRSGVLEWPIVLYTAVAGGNGRVTQRFGERSALYRGKPHNGLDIGAPIGTPVIAADDGEVIAVDNNDQDRWRKYQYGKYVLIKHPNNLVTLYAHLSQQAVKKGATVKRGELIGYSGNTGYATGPHLHFGVYWAPSVIMRSISPAAGLVPLGVTINPEDYL